jgi:hypothetical protein
MQSLKNGMPAEKDGIVDNAGIKLHTVEVQAQFDVLYNDLKQFKNYTIQND